MILLKYILDPDYQSPTAVTARRRTTDMDAYEVPVANNGYEIPVTNGGYAALLSEESNYPLMLVSPSR